MRRGAITQPNRATDISAKPTSPNGTAISNATSR
jgi:hypothetical protein